MYMLIKLFPKLQNSRFKKVLQICLDSKILIVIIAFLALLSNLFSLEIAVLYGYLSIVIIAILFSDDLLCLLPIACCSYYTFSRQNNPLSHDKTSVFLEKTAITNLIIIVSITAVFAISRLVFDIITKEEKRKFPRLTWGFLALGLSYVLGGLLSKYYDGKTAFFGLVQILSLSFCYFYFYFTIDFKKVNKSYFAFLVTIISVLLLFEIIGMLYFCGFFTTSGVFYRDHIYTGWGINNNVAACMCICLPGPFYYATTKKHGWIYLIYSNILFLSLVFIQSRNGIVCGLFLFFVLFISSLAKSTTFNRTNLILTQVFIFIICGVCALVYTDYLQQKLISIIDRGFNDSGRFEIYINGLKQFLDYPIFGNGFYQCGAGRWGNNEIGPFFPARYHNTYVQLLASCGTFALLTYLFHRIQTLKLVFKNINLEKYFMGMTIFALIVTSLLDCHFFNFGPGFLYSAILLLIEINCIQKEGLTIS